jgi:hypothetical protein
MDDHNSYGRQLNQALAAIGPARQATADQAASHAQTATPDNGPGRGAEQPSAAGQPSQPELPKGDK